MTGRSGLLQSMQLQRVVHDCVTEQQQQGMGKPEYFCQIPFLLAEDCFWVLISPGISELPCQKVCKLLRYPRRPLNR